MADKRKSLSKTKESIKSAPKRKKSLFHKTTKIPIFIQSYNKPPAVAFGEYNDSLDGVFSPCNKPSDIAFTTFNKPSDIKCVPDRKSKNVFTLYFL